MKQTKVTLEDVASAASTSKATASMVLAKKMLGRFSTDTIVRVQQAAQQLGYRRSSTKDKNVLIVCPSVFNPYFSTILQSMDMEAISYGYKTIVYNTYWDLERERDVMALVKQHHIDGVVFAMIPQQIEVASELNAIIPVVAVGDYHKDLQFDTVDINNFHAGVLVANHLQELGHRRVAYISTSLNSFHSARMRRLEGLRSAPGLELDIYSEDIEPSTEINNVDIEFETGYQLAKRCIKDSTGVTAMVAINDMVAYGVMNAILDSGLRIPEDYSVCGFDNIFPSRFTNIGLTSVDHQIIQQGKRAMMLLRHRFDNDDDPSEEVTRVEYRCTLIPRGSSAKPKA